MKKLIFYIITFNLQNLIYSIVPLWNFENTAIKLDLPFSYEFTKKDSYGNSLTLKKTIGISENNIIQRNTININNKLKINDAEWENIESFYKYGEDYYYICPKGKYNMYKCNNNNNICEEIKSTQKFDKEWELKCYIHYNIKDKDLITVFYLNIKSIIKSYNLKNPGWEGNVEAHSGLLDFKWTTVIKNDYYSMFAIGINGNRIELFLMKFTYDNEFKYGMIKNRNISQCLNYSYARLNDNNLYFITYNDTTFISGFTKLNGEVTKENIDSINMTINENSPLNFYDEITINKINFIEESQYV